MIYEELYGSKWHKIATEELEGQLRKFEISQSESMEIQP